MPRVLNRPAAARPSRTPAEQLRATMAALRDCPRKLKHLRQPL